MGYDIEMVIYITVDLYDITIDYDITIVALLQHNCMLCYHNIDLWNQSRFYDIIIGFSMIKMFYDITTDTASQ